MRSTKKVFSLLLALAMLASFVTVPAFAATTNTAVTGVAVAAGTTSGIKITVSFDGVSDNISDITATYIIAEKASALSTGTVLSSATLNTDKKSVSLDNVDIASLDAGKTYSVYVKFSGALAANVYDLKSEPFLVVTEAGTKKFGGFGHNIDYTSATFQITATPVKDTASSDDTNTYAANSAIIDLKTETLALPTGYSVAAYSLDGGGKWNSKSLSAGDISKLLNKGMTLVLSNKAIDKTTKKPPVGKAASGADPTAEGYTAAVNGATLITFAAIEARPKDTKLAVNYGLYPANFGEAGQWILAAKDATTVDATAIAPLQIAVAAADKKKADENGWGKFKTGEGINVKTLPDSGKPEKTIYLIRTAPEVGAKNVPASKGYKVTASSQIKAPNLKADYKKEIIKPKADIQIQGPTGTAGALEVTTFTKDAADKIKAGYALKDILTETATQVKVQLKGTAKKPASGVQVITLAPRARLDDADLAPAKGKLKLDKKYEVLKDAATGKYAGLPKIEGAAAAGIKDVRVKATAKADKSGGYTGLAASKNGTIFYDWGVYNPGEKTEKSGVTAATLIGPQYNDGILDLYLVSNSGIDTAGALTVKFAVKGVPGTLDDQKTLKDYFKATLGSVTGVAITVDGTADAKGFTGLPCIKVAYTTSAVPGSLKVEAIDSAIVASDKKVTKVNAATVAVDLTDTAKVAAAKTKVQAITFTAADVTAASDAAKAKAAIEAKIKALTGVPAGVTFEVGTPTGSPLVATVTIKCGTASDTQSVTLSTGGGTSSGTATLTYTAPTQASKFTITVEGLITTLQSSQLTLDGSNGLKITIEANTAEKTIYDTGSNEATAALIAPMVTVGGSAIDASKVTVEQKTSGSEKSSIVIDLAHTDIPNGTTVVINLTSIDVQT